MFENELFRDKSTSVMMEYVVRLFWGHNSAAMEVHLFDIKESALVIYTLSNLDNSLPHLCGGMYIHCMGSERLGIRQM